MAVVKNLMVRIGADFSGMKKGVDGASKEMGRLKRDTARATSRISTDFKGMSNSTSQSLSRIKGAKGIGGVTNELRSLTPALLGSTAALGSFGAGALAASARLGPVGIVLGIITAALTAGTFALYKASQGAVKFESDIGRLNMTLKSGSRAYMEWATAQGLAKSSAAEFGATYGVLLSSFIKDNAQLQSETTNLVQATRVVASATGRTIDDTMQRMRSGLLGNTEAIEDLGIFVNVSMIESTNAFKKFAGDKSWSDIDFQLQQQIRLAAILEQTYARYGNTLQNNTMTKQDLLMEQLKDIKLHLSQSFLPIWDLVIPALTRLAESVSNTTEKIARFVYWLRGWDYDEATKGADEQTETVDSLGDAYQETGKKAKEAKKELAAFDEINQFGSFASAGSGTGSTGSGGNQNDGIIVTDPGNPLSPTLDIPPLPKLQLQFEPPNPPDAGVGAVVTNVISTVNAMVAEISKRVKEMWDDLRDKSKVGAAQQREGWKALNADLNGNLVPETTLALTRNWGGMWDALRLTTQNGAINQQTTFSGMWNRMQIDTVISATTIQAQVARMYENIEQTSNVSTTQVSADWKTMLAGMLGNALVYGMSITAEWTKLKESLLSIKSPLAIVQESWHSTLDAMQMKINAYEPYLSWGWNLIGDAVNKTVPILDETKNAWETALSSMETSTVSAMGTILAKIAATSSAWERMKSLVSGAVTMPSPAPTPIPTVAPSGAITFDPALLNGPSGVFDQKQFYESQIAQPITTAEPMSVGEKARSLPLIGPVLKGLDALAGATKPLSDAVQPFIMPGVGIATGSASIGGNVGKSISEIFEQIRKAVPNFKLAVPALARGGIVDGETNFGNFIAGEAGAELIMPLENTSFVDKMASALGTAVMQSMQFNGAGGSGVDNKDIVLQVDGVTFARLLNAYNAKENTRIGGSMITVT